MKKQLVIIFFLLLTQTSCVPAAIVGGAGAIGYTAAQDRSVGETIDDAAIETKINAKFLAQQNRKDFINITEDSVQGRVLLAGSVPMRETKIQAYNLVWQVSGVKEVINEIKVSNNQGFSAKEYASDTWISTQIESRLLFTKDVKSVNYSVETIDGVVYLMGIAQNMTELNTVAQIASEVSGVQKVKSYVKIKGVPYKSGGSDVDRNPISVQEEQIKTVPGSIKGTQPETKDNLIIEESPKAQ